MALHVEQAADPEGASTQSPSPEYIKLQALYAHWMSIDPDLHKEESKHALNAYYAALARFAGTPHSQRKVAELLSIAVMESREEAHGWDINNGEKAIVALFDAVSELERAGHARGPENSVPERD